MENKEMDELLEKVFSNVNSWLNFAEAKNAANIALVVAGIAGIFSLGCMNVILYIICILLTCSGIASLVAFIPRLGQTVLKKALNFRKNRSKKNTSQNEEENLLFFEVIKEFSGTEYAERIKSVYLQNSNERLTKYQVDLAKEIVYNSDVASCKYRCFKIAAYFDLVAFIILAIALIIA